MDLKCCARIKAKPWVTWESCGFSWARVTELIVTSWLYIGPVHISFQSSPYAVFVFFNYLIYFSMIIHSKEKMDPKESYYVYK